jgi:two-component system sensor histidine kinase EvgS
MSPLFTHSGHFSVRHFYFITGLILILLSREGLALPSPIKLLPRTQIAIPEVTLSEEGKRWLHNNEKIKIAIWGESHPPIFMGYDREVYEGIGADYANILARALNKDVEVYHFPTLLEAKEKLRNNEIDVLAFYTPALSQDRDFLVSKPFLLDHAVVLHKNNIIGEQLNSLKYHKLAFIGDRNLQQQLQDNYPEARLKPFQYYSEAMASLAYGATDAFWLNASTAAFLISQGIETQAKMELSDLAANANVSFAVNNLNPALFDIIEAVMTSLPLASRLRIINNWGLDNSYVMKHNPLVLTREELIWISQHNEIAVYFPRYIPPLSFQDDDGTINGYGLTLLRMISERTGIKFNPKVMSEQTRKGMGHAMVAAMIRTEGNNRDLLSTRSFTLSPWVLVSGNHAGDAISLDELAGKRVAIPRNSGITSLLISRYPAIRFIETNNVTQAFSQVTSRYADAAISTQLTADYLISKHFYRQLVINDAVNLPPAQFAIGVSSDQKILLSVLNKALVDMSPQALQRDLSLWQNYKAPAKVTVWDRYSRYLVNIAIFSLVVLLLIALRNRYLKKVLLNRTLYEQQLEDLMLELQEAKQMADNASRSKSLFLAQMSHEIRTPLNAMIGLLELEHRKKSTQEKRDKNIEVAWRASQSLLSLVGNILDVAKIESGMHSVKKTPVSLTDSIRSLITLFTHAASEKNIALSFSHSVQQTDVIFDQTMFNQIVSNLLSNAIKFTDRGEVCVTLAETVERYILTVSDTGLGMTEDQARGIFEPFVQVGDAQHNTQGTGLGLSICQQLAVMLGGELRVESQLGKGSSFIFRFNAEPCQSDSEWVCADELPQAKNVKLILIADDHAPNRLLLSQQLASIGHQVVAVEDGHQALIRWKMAEKPFDVVITDCNMPGMSGFELVTRLRQKEQQRGLTCRPMFGLTAMAEYEVRERGIAAGMTECLFKPIELDVLLSRLEQDNVPMTLREGGETTFEVRKLQKLTYGNPQAFGEMVKSLLESNRQDISALQKAIKIRDNQQIREHAHRLLGSARLVDAHRLADICREIELAAVEGDNSGILALLASCHAELERLTEIFTVQHHTAV